MIKPSKWLFYLAFRPAATVVKITKYSLSNWHLPVQKKTVKATEQCVKSAQS